VLAGPGAGQRPAELAGAAWLACACRPRGGVRLALTRDRPDSFTARDSELAGAAGHAAGAIENARLLDEAQASRAVATERAGSSPRCWRCPGRRLDAELEPLLNNFWTRSTLVVDYAGASIGVIDGDEFRFLEPRGASACRASRR
jgi:hypothetical protein